MREVDISRHFPSGILMERSVESIRMPRYVIEVVGPSNLSSAVGTLI